MKSSALILGLGNPILSDDGIGILIAQRLAERIPGADVATSACVGLDLLELVTGYHHLFVIDAIAVPDGRPGTLQKLTPEDGTAHLFSSHGINFWEILELGRQLGRPIPEDVVIYGIEIGSEIPFGEDLSAAMEGTLEENLMRIKREICAAIFSLSIA